MTISQYRARKTAYPERMLLWRVGDFYEAFDDDATLLGEYALVIHSIRDAQNLPTPMAGVPEAWLNDLLLRLVHDGRVVDVVTTTITTHPNLTLSYA